MVENEIKSKSIRWWHLLALLSISGIYIWYRVPLLGEVICDTDISGIIYSGWGLADGLLPYRDIFETKPPGTYFLFGLFIKIFGLKVLPINIFAIVWAVLGLIGLFFLTARLVDAKAGIIASMVYALVSASDFFNGICPNYETWAITPGLFGLLLFVLALKNPRPLLLAFFSGALLGLSISMKFQGLFFSVAAGATLLSSLRPFSDQNPKRLIRIALIMTMGGVSVFLFYLAYYAAHGAASNLLMALNPQQGASYAKARTIILFSEMFQKNLLGFIKHSPVLFLGGGLSIVAIFHARKRDDWNFQNIVLLFSWWISLFFAAFFLKGVISDGQFYNHYLILALPGFCAVFGFAASTFFDIPKGWPVVLLAVGAALITMFLGQFQEFNLSCKSYSAQRRAGVVADKYILYEFRDMEFMYGIRTSYHLKDLSANLRRETKPGDTIFVWDPVSMIYILAQRRAPTYYYKPYFSSAHLPWSVHKEGDIALEEIRYKIINELTANPPVFVIHLTQVLAEYPHVEPLFKELKEFLNERYEISQKISDGAFTTWKLKTDEVIKLDKENDSEL